MKKALISGITGQDGSYLARLLLGKGYEVHGIIRRTSTFNTDRIDEIYLDPHESGSRLFLHYGDLTDGTSLRRIMEKIGPEEIYNLGASASPSTSRSTLLTRSRPGPCVSSKPCAMSAALAANPFGSTRPDRLKCSARRPRPRASRPPSTPAVHMGPARRRPTGTASITAKRTGFSSATASCSTTSRRSAAKPSSREKSRALWDASNMGCSRSSSSATLKQSATGDYVEAMWRMLQQPAPDDYVIATGETHSVREFLDEGFSYAGVDWKPCVELDPRYLRPTEVDHLEGDSSKARTKLGWEPKVGFKELVRMMVDHDMELARQECTLRDAGHKIAARRAI
jgi:GDPmannose 4,6-dehydratase